MEIMNIFLLSKDWILTKSHSKFHYQIAYKIGMNRNEYILLDVLYEDTHYKKSTSSPYGSTVLSTKPKS